MEDSTTDDNPPHSQLTKGCILCYEGAKMVLFITGMCKRDCWYCPLSSERKNNDVVFANERPVTGSSDIIEVAQTMSALGTGITGGEPFFVPDRLISYATLLKETFGKEHHIHLYSGIAPSVEELGMIQGIVDEIRLHPPVEHWQFIHKSPYYQSVQKAREMDFVAGFEVPSLPELQYLIPILPDIDLLTINELEWGESNADNMRARGKELADSCHNAVKDAYLAAQQIEKHEKVHFCTSEFKDSVQLRMRLKRIAHNTARSFDEITEDGTIVYGVVEGNEARTAFNEELDPELFSVFPDRVETAWWILEDMAPDLPGKKYIIERYPDGGMVTEVIPL